MKDFSNISNAHPAYIDALYNLYVQNPEQVEPGWRQFFKGFDFNSANSTNGHISQDKNLNKEFAVAALIDGFRHRGHLLSDTNPIRKRIDRRPKLEIADYGLDQSDLNSIFSAAQIIGLQACSLEQIIQHLQKIYTQHIGFEYSHIENHERRMWLRDKIENRNLNADFGFSIEKKKRILEKLNDAVIFEKFLHTKYVGQKRFSLEGGESTIVALDALLELSGLLQVEEMVIGMAHRGRLNVLANTIGKTYEQIFNEFEGNAIPDLSFGSGDVKYHLGFSSQIKTESGKTIQVKLAPNPSHLEAVNPVVEGMSRAKADLLYGSDYDRILPVLIHGDAAVVGQGIVYETMQMSQLEGYYTGGSIHFVINNQIGFTTDFDDARSSTYSTAAANLVQAPVFHVNGDDPEAVVFVIELALAYRQEFNADVFVDMVCYRRHGHNEGDDPKFTQPEMYDIISDHKNVRELYIDKLSERGQVEEELAKKLESAFWKKLQDRLDEVKQNPLPYSYQKSELAWKKIKLKADKSDFQQSPETGLELKKLNNLLRSIISIPTNFNALPKINRLIKSWQQLIDSKKLDWALAELLAYATILEEGKNVRLSGQDVKRGTFSHRHAVLFDEENNHEYNRLSGLQKEQGQFFIYNSLLSEFAVLGFEYGYSLATPEQLVIWEAQFGDFSNGAQVIFDQFISCGESKWNRMSGLVMLLPHGYDGQGPEHSSARLERYLQACAEQNIVVANVSTPANFFHLLRRQVEWPFRKPLIVMSPKSLLRHTKCISHISEFGPGTHFNEVIDEELISPKKIRKILLCSGQLYYELITKREEQKVEDIIIIRIEQLYPFPYTQLEEILSEKNCKEIYWIQEEPANMGAANFILQQLTNHYPVKIISRKASASPATGFKKIHEMEQAELIQKAFE